MAEKHGIIYEIVGHILAIEDLISQREMELRRLKRKCRNTMQKMHKALVRATKMSNKRLKIIRDQNKRINKI